jgi:hypothetical protein
VDELFEAVLAGEHGEDLTPAEAKAFEAWLGTERGQAALATAEDELNPLADSFDPADPGADAWAAVEGKIMEGVRKGAVEDSGVIVRPPELAAERNWGGLALLAAGLLFAAAIGLISMGPGDGKGKGGGLGMIKVKPPAPLSAEPQTLAPPSGAPARVESLEAGEGYEAESAIVDSALLVITVQTKKND